MKDFFTNLPDARTAEGNKVTSDRREVLVEDTGFEPVTSCLPGKRSSQLS